MRLLRLLLPALWLVFLPVAAQAQNLLGTSLVRSDQVTAELVAHAPQGLGPGQTVWVGLKLQHAQDWHTYWKNPGDSGLPTQMEWQLPAGVEAGDIAWPTPKKFPLPPLANYGYDGTVLLPVALTLPPHWNGSRLEVGLTASWLACKTECIPEDGQFRLSLNSQAPPMLHGSLFESAHLASPKKIAPTLSKSSAEGVFLSVSAVGLPSAWRGRKLTFFPETPAIIEPGADWQQSWQGDTWTARIPLSSLRTESPEHLPVVIAHQEGLAHGQAAPAGVYMDLPVLGAWPAPPSGPATGLSPALEAALKQNAENQPGQGRPPMDGGLAAALLGALLGGLILNLMPCVFPVLAIKVLAFTQHPAGADAAALRRRHRASGLAYTAGVVLSFVALGGMLVGLRAAGEQLGWGFQLQSPAVVALLAALFTLIGLNLAGVFELGHVLPSRVASLQARNPTVDAFLTGVLATAVASPCTAPFMGASLGFAVGLPPAQALLVFGAIGAGMALPYLLASWVPAVAHALPRPGAWMETFKQFMAFPMWATVVWLVWVLGQQTGVNGAGALLALLVVLALWVWSWTRNGRTRWWMGGLASVVAVVLGTALGPLVLQQENPSAATPSHGAWEAWTPVRAEELARQGRTVFVDFTAAWCVTCQYNKRTTLADAAVLADFRQHNVALLRADWTRRDPAVTAALAQVGRNGVPTYVLHAPGRAPRVLSEVLSVSEVRGALQAP